MQKPVIFTIDDDASVLSSIERDLRGHFGKDYRIVPIDQGKAALEYLNKLEQRNETVALFLVDQRMPEMSGTEFLLQAMKTFPQAKRVLLTAYADTQAAIDSINEVGLDYYLIKPWHPPEEKLYPVLDELLNDWKAHIRLPYEGIRIYGTMWSTSSHAAKEFLTRYQIPYQWLNIERDPQARKIVESVSPELKLPVIFFPDGTNLVEPSLTSLANKVGLQTHAANPFYDIVVIGGGPSGLGAAVYAGSEGYKCLLIEKDTPGGQAGSAPKIENYLGFPSGISGDDLTRRAVSQAKRFGVEIISAQQAVSVLARDSYRIVKLDDGSEVSCHAVLIATGSSFHKLDNPGAEALTGAGVYYGAAFTEAINFKDQHLFVIGGANSAAEGALYLTRYAAKVTVLIRGSEPTASKYLVDALNANEKIEILYNTELVDVVGQHALEKITIQNNKTKATQTLEAGAVFVFIGVKPMSKIVSDLVLLNDKGFILTGTDLKKENKLSKNWPLERDPYLLETSVPGIFAAGDVRAGANPRVASAVGEGALAFALIKEYLKNL